MLLAVFFCTVAIPEGHNALHFDATGPQGQSVVVRVSTQGDRGCIVLLQIKPSGGKFQQKAQIVFKDDMTAERAFEILKKIAMEVCDGSLEEKGIKNRRTELTSGSSSSSSVLPVPEPVPARAGGGRKRCSRASKDMSNNK